MNIIDSSQDLDMANRFLNNGFIVFDVENQNKLNQIRDQIGDWVVSYLGLDNITDIANFLDNIHKYINKSKVNELRLYIISRLASNDLIRETMYSMGKNQLESLVGNELAVQRQANLSIQMPQDDSSLLALHSDVWSGNSPYEVVLWLPLVNCFNTKSMYLLNLEQSVEASRNFENEQITTEKELFKRIESDIEWLDVPFGKAVIFSHTLLHGNQINQEQETRWSINIRFKSLLSPYGNKGVGESFVPLNIKPATRIGYNYSGSHTVE